MSRTVLIGLDGATFTVLDQLCEEGVMPFLRDFMGKGVRAKLRSTPNCFTPPAWTTLMTGCQPGRHGIFDFVRVLPGDGPPQYTIATSRDVHCETIWSMASRQDCRVVSLNFPLMFPPRPVNGFVVPGFVPPRHLRRFVYPRTLYDELRALPGFRQDELLLDMDAERKLIQQLPREKYGAWIELHIRRERQWAAIAKHLLTEQAPDLIAVLFDGVDKLQHLCWRFLDPALQLATPTDWERAVPAQCLQYFRELDGHIADLVHLAGHDARVFLPSDHGFGATAEIFYVNALLHRMGLLAWADGVASDRHGKQMTEGHKNPTVLFDWDRTVAYALTSGSNGIYIKVARKPGDAGVSAQEYADFRGRLAQKLLDFVDPQTGRRVVQKVLTREDAFPGECCHIAPDLTLVLRDFGFVSTLRSDVLVRPRSEVAGTHQPDGVFLAKGPGIRANTHWPASASRMSPPHCSIA